MKIIDEVSCESAAATLHDARFTTNEIMFDPHLQTFLLKCYVFAGNESGAMSPEVWESYELFFSGVTHCRITQEEYVRFCEISTFRFNSNNRELTIFTHYAVEITLEFKQMTGFLTKTNETRSW